MRFFWSLAYEKRIENWKNIEELISMGSDITGSI